MAGSTTFGGIADSLEYFEMQLDSYDTRVSPSANFSPTDWPLYYLTRPLTNVAAIKVLEAEIPFSFYVFNSNNNTFLLNIPGQGVTNAVVTIPVGNYNATTLSLALSTALTQAAIGQVPGFSLTFQTTYSGETSIPSTGKFTINLFENTRLIGIAWSLTFGADGDNGNLNPRLFLGFNSGITSSTFISGTGNLVVAQNCALITGPNYLYVNSRRLGNLCNMYLPAGASNLGGGISGPQLAKIPVSVQPNGTIFWQDADPSKWFDLENLSNFTDADFYLTLGNSSNQIPLQLNGLSFSIKLGILVNKVVSTNLLGGHVAHGRVFSRMTL